MVGEAKRLVKNLLTRLKGLGFDEIDKVTGYVPDFSLWYSNRLL